jgi:hypothetical protein
MKESRRFSVGRVVVRYAGRAAAARRRLREVLWAGIAMPVRGD